MIGYTVKVVEWLTRSTLMLKAAGSIPGTDAHLSCLGEAGSDGTPQMS